MLIKAHKETANHHDTRTFHSERGGAYRLSVVILGLTAVDARVLRRDVEQHQSVLLFVVQESAPVAGGQSLGVFVPGHLRKRDAIHLQREANRST